MKKYIVVGLLVISFILSPVFVSAQTSQQEQINTLIRLLQSLVQLLQQQLLTLRGGQPLSPQPTVTLPPSLPTCIDQQDGSPVINHLTNYSGPIGTILEIKGCNLSGFEGDLNVYFEKSDGKKIMLTDTFGDYAKTDGSLIKVVVKEPCQPGETVYGPYSGIPAQCNYVAITPGLYKVYTEPWGKRSNTVNFTVTAPVVGNNKCGLTVNSPTPNSSVSFPLTVTGVVDDQITSKLGCSWQTFEGIAGTAQFYIFLNEINHKGWTPIGDVVRMQLESSATGKSSFSLVFNYPEGGFQVNAPIKIVFTEENVAVIRPSLTFELPLVLR